MKYCPPSGLETKDLIDEYEANHEDIERLKGYARLTEEEDEELQEAETYEYELLTEIEKRLNCNAQE